VLVQDLEVVLQDQLDLVLVPDSVLVQDLVLALVLQDQQEEG